MVLLPTSRLINRGALAPHQPGEINMTNAENKKLDTIIGKLEALQNSMERKTQKEEDAMRAAKSRLISILKY